MDIMEVVGDLFHASFVVMRQVDEGRLHKSPGLMEPLILTNLQ